MAKAGLPRRVSSHEAGQVAAGADVDKQAQAVGVHGLDRLAERDGLGPLRDGQLADRLGIVGHPPARRTRIDRDARRTEASSGRRIRRSGPTTGLEARRVIGPRRTAGLPAGCSRRAGGRRPARPPPAARPGRPGAGSCPSRRRRRRRPARDRSPRRGLGRRRRRPGGPRAGRRTTRNRARSPRAGRACCSSSRSVGKTPAADRARISPLLWPSTASGRRPSRVNTWYKAHWALRTTFTAVAVDQSFSSPPGTGPNKCSLGGTVSPRSRAIRSAVSNSRRTSGKWKQSRRACRDTASPRPGRGTPGPRAAFKSGSSQ